MSNNNVYISQLPLKMQCDIRKDVKAAGINGSLLNDAMNSRLCDLEDTINIKPYLQQLKEMK